MKRRKSDREHLAELQEFARKPSAQAALQRLVPLLPPEIANWLAKLRLLYGVPFNHLVVDHRMLPIESIRFFYLDPEWLESLVDGALNLGTDSSRDEVFLQTMRRLIRDSVTATAAQIRGRLFRKPVPEEVQTGGTATGFLLRSAVVSGWPAMQVRGYGAGDVLLEIARLEQLASDVLLGIFDGIPVKVEFEEPSEGLRFGVRDGDKIVPRGLGATEETPPGKQLTTDDAKFAQMEFRGDRVIDVLATRQRVKERLEELNALPVEAEVSPADFAVQLLHSPDLQPFSAGEGSPVSPPARETERPQPRDDRSILEELL